MTPFLAILCLIITLCASQNCTKWLESITFPKLSVHNAYHYRQTRPFTIDVDGTEISMNTSVPRFSYTFPTFTELLSNGVVGLEIDPHPKTTEDGDDIYVYHIETYDQTSSCETYRECLQEINTWFINNNYTISSPLLLYIEPKDVDEFSSDQLKLINSILAEIFDETDILYTPKDHQNGADLLDTVWDDWSDVCIEDVENMIIPIINTQYVELIDDDTFRDLNLFPMCKCQTDADYCIVLQDRCKDITLDIDANNTDGSDNRHKYLYRKLSGTEQYPQNYEYPLVYNISGDYEYGEQLLGIQVPDALITKINNGKIVNPMTIDQWQFWQIITYVDEMNNGNGVWEQEDLVKYLEVLAPGTPLLSFAMNVLFWKEDMNDMDILDPDLWAKAQCLFVDGDYGADKVVIDANLSSVYHKICEQIDVGYHYLYTDFPYYWTDFQDFTMDNFTEDNYKEICDNITITTYIQPSTVTVSECVTKTELINTIIWIFVGFFAAFLLFVVLPISIILYCCICKKMGCQIWCQDKCCKCCCKCKCCTRDDVENREQLEFTTYS